MRQSTINKNKNLFNMKTNLLVLPALALSAAIISCGGGSSPADHDHHHNHDSEDERLEAAIVFPHEMEQRASLTIEPCRKEPFGEVISTMARLTAAQGDSHDLVARCSGTIRMGSRPLAEGMSLTAGEALLYVESEGEADGGVALSLKEAETSLALARQEMERKEELALGGIVARGEALKARADYESALARYESLKSHFSGGRQTISAPTSGFLTSLSVGEGSWVEAGQRVATMSRGHRLWLQADIPPRYYSLLNNIVGAAIRPEGSDEAVPLDSLGGKLLAYGKELTGGSTLLPVRFEINSSEGLLAGTLVELFIKTRGDGRETIVVGRDAIVEEMGVFFVFVELADEHYEKREVKLGLTDGLKTQILQGLEEGERVVEHGAIWLKLAQSAGTLDVHSGHVH